VRGDWKPFAIVVPRELRATPLAFTQPTTVFLVDRRAAARAKVTKEKAAQRHCPDVSMLAGAVD
jgi:hypothetical protein